MLHLRRHFRLLVPDNYLCNQVYANRRFVVAFTISTSLLKVLLIARVNTCGKLLLYFNG